MKKITLTVLVSLFLMTPAIAENNQPIFTISGSMDTDTDSFKLEAGKHWLVAETGKGHEFSWTCVWLTPEDNHPLSGYRVCSGKPEGERMKTTVRGITKGEYYIQVISTGSWKVWVYKAQ